MSRFRRCTALCLAVLTSVLTLSSVAATSANAEDFSGTGKAVPASGQATGSKSARSVIVGRIDGSSLVKLNNDPGFAAKGATDEGRIAEDHVLNMAINLRRSPEQQAALDELNQQVRTPGNAMYGQTLTPEEFAESFGLSQKDVATLTEWLQSKGFHVTAIHVGQNLITFRGTAAQAQAAFATEIHTFTTKNGQTYFGPTSALHIPSALAPAIKSIDGLQSYVRVPYPGFDGPVAVAAADPTQSQHDEAVSAKPENKGWYTALPGAELRSLSAVKQDVHSDSYAVTTTTASIAPGTVVFASGTSATITAVVAWTATGTPTGTVTLSDSDGTLGVSIALSSCTLGSSQYTCTYAWTAASGAGSSPDTMTASYGGDSNFAQSSGTTSLALTYSTGASTIGNLSLTVTPGTVVQGATTAQTITAVITGTGGRTTHVPSGNLMLFGYYGINEIHEFTTIATASGCSTSTYVVTCTYTWNPPATLAAGSYTIEGAYSGDTHFAAYNFVDTTPFTVTASGTTTSTTTVTASPSTTEEGGGTTFTTVTTWTGTGAQATGSIALSGPTSGTYGGGPLGGATYPATGSTTSSGSGSYDFGDYTYSYNCTTSTSAKTVTCTITDSNDWDVFTNSINAPTTDVVTATYSGDTVYKKSSGTVTLTLGDSEEFPTSVSVSPNPTSVVYGAGTSVTYTISIDDEFELGTKPTGTLSLSGTVIAGGTTSINANTSACSYSTSTFVDTCTITATVPVGTAPGNYTVTAVYSGDANYSGSTGTGTVSVDGNTPTSIAVSATPLTVNAVTPTTTVTAVVTWTGSGGTPTGTVSLTCGSPSAGTCEELPSPVNVSSCTISTSAKTISCSIAYALDSDDTAFGNYTLVATYSGDADYQGASGSVVVDDSEADVASTTTLALTPTSVKYGAGTSVAFAATVKGVSGDGHTTGTIVFSNPTLGTIGTITTPTGCTASNGYTYVCTLNATIPVTTPGGSYTITAAYSGNATVYEPSSGTATLTVTTATPTATASNVSGAFESTVTLSATDTGATAAAAPTGVPTFKVNGTTVTGTPSCSSSAAVETCTLSYTLPSSLTSASTYPISVSFAADTNYALATASGTLTVSNDATSTSVSASPTSITTAQTTVLTAIVTDTTTASVVPTGTVTFTLGSTSGTQIGSCTLSAGTCSSAAISGTTLGIGSDTVYANYAGVTSEFTSSSGSTGVTVTSAGPANGYLTFTAVSHNFGQVAVGTAATPFGINIKNTGTAAYPFVLNFTPANGFTYATNCPTSIAVGGSCELVFYFTPTSTGPVSTTWSLASESGFGYTPSNGGTLQGSGTPNGGVSLTTNGHDFGTVAVGTQSPTYGTELSNSTTSPETISLGTVSAPFTMITNCGTTLAPGSSCEIEFYFTPTSTSPVSVVVPLSGSPTAITSGGSALPNGGITLSGN